MAKIKAVKKLAEKYPVIKKFFDDRDFAAIVKLFLSLALNLAFGVYNAVLGAVYGSSWHGVLAAYYIALVGMRTGIIFGYRCAKSGARSKEYYGAACHLATGILLFALHTAIAFMVHMVEDGSFRYDGLLIYVYAVYAFYKAISAAVNFVRTAKTHDLLIEALRNINLADSLISIYALQVAMLTAFGTLPNANVATGSAICGVIMALGIFMVVRASIKIYKLSHAENKTLCEVGEDQSYNKERI